MDFILMELFGGGGHKKHHSRRSNPPRQPRPQNIYVPVGAAVDYGRQCEMRAYAEAEDRRNAELARIAYQCQARDREMMRRYREQNQAHADARERERLAAEERIAQMETQARYERRSRQFMDDVYHKECLDRLKLQEELRAQQQRTEELARHARYQQDRRPAGYSQHYMSDHSSTSHPIRYDEFDPLLINSLAGHFRDVNLETSRIPLQRPNNSLGDERYSRRNRYERSHDVSPPRRVRFSSPSPKPKPRPAAKPEKRKEWCGLSREQWLEKSKEWKMEDMSQEFKNW